MAVSGAEKYGRELHAEISGRKCQNNRNGAELRIISKEQPMAQAVLTEKNLEDAFLLYFGEKSEER